MFSQENIGIQCLLRLLLVKENMTVVVVVVVHAMVTWAPTQSRLLVRVADTRRTIQQPQDPRRQGWVCVRATRVSRGCPPVSWYWRTPPFCCLFVSLCSTVFTICLNWAPISSFLGFTCYLRQKLRSLCCASKEHMFLLYPVNGNLPPIPHPSTFGSECSEEALTDKSNAKSIKTRQDQIQLDLSGFMNLGVCNLD